MAPKPKSETVAKAAEALPPDFAKAFADVTVRDVEDGKPVVRPLREDDVLSWRQTDELVVIVTVDGRKLEARK